MSSIRLACAAILVLALTACGGSSLGNILGGVNPINSGLFNCDPGTQVQLANPQPGQTGVSPNIGQIIIVANGNNNTLYNTYNQWNLTLTDQYGNNVQGGNLTPVPYTTGPHPYASDYYYASSIGQLPTGSTWTVRLNEQNANCQAVPLNSFST